MFYVPPEQAQEAWEAGASNLTKACARGDDDVTAAQLLEYIRAGKKTLLGYPGGWLVVEIQQYPNRRALHVDAMYAPGANAESVFEELKAFALHNGCDSIQGACQPASVRLWSRKFGFRPAFTMMRFNLKG